MAGLKTPKKKRDDKPSFALVLFLVFFSLLSIVLGVVSYFGYDGQDKLRVAAKEAALTVKGAKLGEEYNQFISWDTRLALGVAPLDPDELTNHATFLKKFSEGNADYKKEKSFEVINKMIDENKKELGFDGNRYTSTYKEKNRNLTKELTDLRSLLANTQAELRETNEKFLTREATEKKRDDANKALIKKGNDQALNAAKDKSAEMVALITTIGELENKIKDMSDADTDKTEKFVRELKKLKIENRALAEKANEVLPGGTAKAAGDDRPHALLLDISKARTLWDNPLGKIVRVDQGERQVYINLGSSHGVKPELTFTVFAAGPTGRADKALKGTIEVIRVIDANTSLARITSLYDEQGNEIVFAAGTKGLVLRESENALKDGDLLFNMFWGARVAIAGNVPFGGIHSDSPAEQMRSLANFIGFLYRQGITVDGYLDLTDGQVKGAVTSRTRYFIRGDNLVEAKTAEVSPFRKKQDEPAKGAEGSEEKKDEAKKDEAKKEELKKDDMPKDEAAAGNGDRVKSLNEAAAAMRKDAQDKGLFVISADNFLNVIGYRQPRSANIADPSGYRPSVISAGQGPARPPSPADKKDDKEGEPKAKEKEAEK